MNEPIFFIQTTIISFVTLGALTIGPSCLTACIAVNALLANLFVLKQITLFGFSATASDTFMVGSLFGLQLLQERYGKRLAQQAVITSFFLLTFYTIMSYLHLLYIPTLYDTTHTHFYALLQFMPRITIASIAVYTVVSYFDTYLFAFFKQLLKNQYMLLRTTICIIIVQLADTVLFSFLGLYGLVEHVWHIIFISFTIKMITILITRPFVALSNFIPRA